MSFIIHVAGKLKWQYSFIVRQELVDSEPVFFVLKAQYNN